MTVVGKLLVFMNLVFSLVVGAFAVMDYTARTHWADSYEKLKKDYSVAAGTAAAYKAEADTKTKQLNDLNAMLMASGDKDLKVVSPDDPAKVAKAAVALLDERARSIDALKKQLDDRGKENADLKADVAQARAIAKVSVSDVSAGRDNSEKVLTQLNEERTKNNALVKEKNDLRDQKVAAEIDRNAAQARAEQLVQDNLRLEKLNAAMKATGGGLMAAKALGGPTPPPSDVEGLVKKAEGNLVTISVGSDAGIQRDHVLQVFRLGQNPKYVGRIRIVSVSPTGAVGQAEGRTNGPMQVGDRVGTSILGRN